MYRIKTMNKIAQVGLSQLDPARYAVSEEFTDPDAILVRSAKLHDMPLGESLLAIGRAGAGVNNIPCDKCAAAGIVVFNTPGANAEAVKELAVCALILASRDVIGGAEWVRSIADQGDAVAALVEKGKSAFVGPEIMGKSLGVIGLGAIGARIANDAVALGMKVYGYDPYLSVDAAWNLSRAVIHATDVGEIYEKCDYITLHVPYLPSTHHTINEETIARMKPGVRILNLARGELVDDDAMLSALTSGRVARYVTDFPNGKTAGAKGVVAIPHLGASTPESEDNCAVMATQEIMDYLENGNITHSVNMPAAKMPRNGDPRLCVIHRNVPNMIARITEALSARGVNIENMVNAGQRGNDYAYTMIDMDTRPAEIESILAGVDGIIRVRVV